MRLIIFILLCSLSVKGQIITASAPYRITASAPYEYILDSYTTAAGAWSLRKLKSDYSGNCIKVRRSSDNTEQDIGFVNNEIDTASLKSFVGSNNGFVTTWYDQSGNGYNLSQTTSTNQPAIIESGVVYRQFSKVSVKFTSSSSHYLTNTSISASSVANAYVYQVYKSNSAVNNYPAFGMGSNALIFLHGTTPNKMHAYAGNINGDFSNSSTSLHLSEMIYNGGGASNADRLKYYMNSTGLTAGSYSGTVPTTITGTGLSIARLYAVGIYFDGAVSELVLWFNDKSGSRTGIESNVNTYYTIY